MYVYIYIDIYVYITSSTFGRIMPGSVVPVVGVHAGADGVPWLLLRGTPYTFIWHNVIIDQF